MFKRHSKSALLHFSFLFFEDRVLVYQKGGDMVYKRAWSSDRYLRDNVDLAIDNSIILN